jgi:hypothetical protein
MESSDLQFNNRIPELVRVQLADLREEIRQLNERILKLENARQPVMHKRPGRPRLMRQK